MKIYNTVLFIVICVATLSSGGCLCVTPVGYEPVQYMAPVVDVDSGFYYYNGYYYGYGYRHYGGRSHNRRPAGNGNGHRASTTTTKGTVRTQSTSSKH